MKTNLGNHEEAKVACPRLPHALLDAESRFAKAKKTVAVLCASTRIEGASLLEVGTGSGIMARYFAEQVGPNGRVVSVDVSDQRLDKEGYYFEQVADTHLPFPESTFDVVVTNHVIEHVGDEAAQLHHLNEIRRVLQPSGCVYLAVPNRWRLVEPHYKLLFLSWPPRSLRTPYLRTTRKGQSYDCEPLSHKDLVRLVRQAGFDFEQKTFDAMRAMLKTESLSILERLILGAPMGLLRLLYPLIPTIIFLLRPKPINSAASKRAR